MQRAQGGGGTIDRLVAHDAVLALYDPREAYSDGAGTIRATAANDRVGIIRNAARSGLYDLRAASDPQRPGWNGGLLDFASHGNGSGDALRAVFPPGLPKSDLTIIYLYRGTDDNFVPFCEPASPDGSALGAIAQAGSAEPATYGYGSLWIDGVRIADLRDAVHRAHTTGAIVICEHRNKNFGSWATLQWGDDIYDSFEVAGNLVPVAMLDATAPDYAVALVAVRGYAAELARQLG